MEFMASVERTEQISTGHIGPKGNSNGRVGHSSNHDVDTGAYQ